MDGMKGFMAKKRSGGKVKSLSHASGKKGTASKPSPQKVILNKPDYKKMVQPSAKARQSR